MATTTRAIYEGRVRSMRTFTEEEVEEMMDSRVGENPKTNAERIRSMSDEELASLLKYVKTDYQWSNPDYPSEDDFGAWLEWLQSEVEE